MLPLVSVCTATHDRDFELIRRCLGSIAEQTYGNIETIVVVDDNPEYAARIADQYLGEVRVVPFNDLWRTKTNRASNGAWQWFLGTHLAEGEIIAFIGDDDEYLPQHIERHVEALSETGADYSLSKGDFYVAGEYVFTVGDGTARITHLDSDAIVARKDSFRVANWRQDGSNAPDYDLVLRWHNAGLKGAFVDEVTYKHHDGWLARNPELVAAARRGEDWRALLVVA